MDATTFLSKLPIGQDGCWLWEGATTGDGYGIARDGAGHHRLTHRWAYELLVGPIPEALELDHLCRNRLCCNPAHLEPVTRLVNQRRGYWATKTHCPSGHPYDDTNTYRYVRKNGQQVRQCRACNRTAVARSNARRSAS